MIHVLKTWTPYFTRISSGEKTFEVRKNDRDYQVGDILKLVNYDPETNQDLGHTMNVKVTYILHGGQLGIEAGYVVMSIEKVS